MLDLCDNIEGKSFCPLGDAAAWPIQSAIKQFPEDFRKWVQTGVQFRVQALACSNSNGKQAKACTLNEKFMGKGDKRTKKGKIFAGSYGKSRPKPKPNNVAPVEGGEKSSKKGK